MSIKRVPISDEFNWQLNVKSRITVAILAGLSPAKGDRYILTDGANINKIGTYNGSTWDYLVPTEGFITWVDDENLFYKFDGTNWNILVHTQNTDQYLDFGGVNELAVANIVKATPIVETYIKPKTGVAVPTVSGLDDLTSDAILAWEEGYTGEANAIFDIKISTAGTPDKYQYRKDGGDWSAEKDIIGYSNFLTGGTASASSSWVTFTPEKACDGDTSTRWYSQVTPSFPEWWKYDLGEGNTKIIKRINLKFGARTNYTEGKTCGWLTFKIQGSNDDTNWDDLTPLMTKEIPGLLLDITNTTDYRYYRIYFTESYIKLYGVIDNRNWKISTREVEMYEESVGSDYIHLGEQVFVKFTANTGHTAEDYWTINCQGYATTNDGSTEELALNFIDNALYHNPRIKNTSMSELDVYIGEGNYLENVGGNVFVPFNTLGLISIYGDNATVYSYYSAAFQNSYSKSEMWVESITTIVMVQSYPGIAATDSNLVAQNCILGALPELSVSYGLSVSHGGRITSINNIPDPVNPCTNDAMASNGGIIIQDADSTLVLDYSAGGFVTSGANIVGADYEDAITKKHDPKILGTKEIDETGIDTGKFPIYNAVSGKLEYGTNEGQDGGFANSIYLISQIIDGGDANE